MIKIKVQGLEPIIFNEILTIKGTIPGYTMEQLELVGKVCETSVAIYPTAEYLEEEDKFCNIRTELSCNDGKLVSLFTSNELLEYIEADGERFTLRELYEKFKGSCRVIYGCEFTDVKVEPDQLQQLIKCRSDFACDYCYYKRGQYYAFDFAGCSCRMELLGVGSASDDNTEFYLNMTTPELMREIERLEAME